MSDRGGSRVRRRWARVSRRKVLLWAAVVTVAFGGFYLWIITYGIHMGDGCSSCDSRSAWSPVELKRTQDRMEVLREATLSALPLFSVVKPDVVPITINGVCGGLEGNAYSIDWSIVLKGPPDQTFEDAEVRVTAAWQKLGLSVRSNDQIKEWIIGEDPVDGSSVTFDRLGPGKFGVGVVGVCRFKE